MADILEPFPDEELSPERLLKTLSRVLNNLRSSQYRGESYLPYYTEKYGAELKEIIDLVSRTGKPVLIPLQDLALNTLRNKVSQAQQYLQECMDKDGRYKRLLTSSLEIRITRRGAVISPRREKDSLKGFVMEDWRPELEKFIEEAQHKDRFVRFGIPISDDDLSWLRRQFDGLEDKFLTDISYSGIIVVRYDKDKDDNQGTPQTPN